LGAVVAIVASGCGDSGYQFVQNDDLGIYARIPEDWTVYDETDLFPDDSERERDQQSAVSWVRTFDAADEPSVEQSQNIGASTPTGAVQVLALGSEQRDALNLSMLRGRGDPARDPLVLEEAGPVEGQPRVRVLVDEPIDFGAAGFSGVHTVFRMDVEGATAVIDRTAVRNDATTAVAFFEVSCSDTCYFETHKDEIADLVDSWTIQEVQ
jgi:hypothetical protein